MIRLFSLLLFFIPFFILCHDASAQAQARFSPVAALPKTGYIYGVVKIPDGRAWKTSSVSFRKGDRVYAVVPDNQSAVFPAIKVSSMGFYKDFAVIGGQESEDLRNAWIIMLYLGKEPRLVDAVKYSLLDNYDYDFYFDLPSIDAPGDIGDMDGNGMPETELDFYQRKFRMLLKISEKGLHIDYSSPYYIRSFNKLKNSAEKDEYQFREYLLYGILTGRISERDGVEKFVGRNSSEMGNAPSIISKAVELKKLAGSLGASDMLTAYFSGELEAQDVAMKLDEKGRDSSAFMFAVFELEKELNLLHLDEVAFNDFTAYFSDGIDEAEFRKSAARSLASYSGDIYSILTNFRSLDSALHKTPALKLQSFDIK